MKIIRSFLFMPADKERMLDKMGILSPDAFILDLEDSVSANNKEIARINIANKLASSDIKDKVIFIRVNDLDSNHIFRDIDSTIGPGAYGYMIPKFEDTKKLEKIINYISEKETKLKLDFKLKLIIMVESAKGLLELNKTGDGLSDRVTAIALGAEDYLFSLSQFGTVSDTMVDFARKIIVLYSKANGLLSIDTVFRNYKDIKGLKDELEKIKGMGFSSKLAIHPDQIDIINSGLSPEDAEIDKARIILKYKKDIEDKGAISIDGIMYDLPHLKWAQKIEAYLGEINKG
jgi:citrate lyase subunit beta / citryl-CoA lyase